MLWENFKHLFHESWHAKIRSLIESEITNEVYRKIKEESASGVKIAPLSKDTYKVFQLCPLDKIKCIIVLLCPYHSMIGNQMVSDGCPMSCSYTKALQPSLLNFYHGLENELFKGLNLKYEATPDLSYLLEQGVFMYNVALTTPIGKAAAHLHIWQDFSKYMFENIFSYLDVPVVFMGQEAGKYKKYLAPLQRSFQLKHPAASAYSGETWSTEGVFTQINQILKDSNGKEFTINWLKPIDENVPWD